MILKNILAKKIGEKIVAFDKAKLFKKFYHILGFREKGHFSQKIVIITSTPESILP
jgi:hypothetical protein